MHADLAGHLLRLLLDGVQGVHAGGVLIGRQHQDLQGDGRVERRQNRLEQVESGAGIGVDRKDVIEPCCGP